jgi:phosphatidylglycerophosphatase A
MTLAGLIATVGGVGLLKPAPGSWGSALAVALGYGVFLIGGLPLLLVFIALFTAVGIWAAEVYGRATGISDNGAIVIDEVAGQWIALIPAALMLPGQLWPWIAAFTLFRLFDIWKPWPIRWADRSVKGGWGVMLDDLLAGIAAAAGLWALLSTIERLPQ